MKFNFHVLPLFGLIAVIAFTLGATIFSSPTVTSGNEEGTMSLTYHAVQCVYVQRAGETEQKLWECNPNLFTFDGMNATRDRLSFAIPPAGNLVNVIALANKAGADNGTCVPALAPTDTFLCGEYTHAGLSRVAADAVRYNITDGNTQGNWTIMRQFTNTHATASMDVNSTGLFNTTTVNQTGEIFFAENTFTTVTLAVNDRINVTWFIWVT